MNLALKVQFRIGLCVFVVAVLAIAAQPSQAQFVTDQACENCHTEQYDAWKFSHHAKAMDHATAESVLGNFDDAAFAHHGVTSRFYRRDGNFYVETEGADGEMAEFKIEYVFGFAPLQQYVIAFPGGRLQALDIAWDVEKKRWFHLYPDQELKAGDGQHWTGPYKNLQARCAECHQTDFAKGYDPKKQTYESTWSDQTVSCEACHGPGGAHVAWARDPDALDTAASADEKGLRVSFRKGAAESEIQICAGCHARREPLGSNSPPPGDPFADHYNLALLRDGLYHPDGQIDDEVYVYGSFLQSSMYARGVSCTNCHDPHTAELVATEAEVCSQCHNPSGNLAFPTLRLADYDTTEHHHHADGSAGAQCTNCHMPAKNFMMIDARRDHSFRVPRPDLSINIGAPNACSGCHEDRTVEWAAGEVKRWFPDGRSGRPHFGEVVAAARMGDYSDTIRTGLLSIAKDAQESAIVRATALDLLRPVSDSRIMAKVTPLLSDESDLVRAATARLFRPASPEERYQWVGPLVTDELKSVRIAAARELWNIPSDSFPEADRAKIGAAIAEYQRSLVARSDYPETQMAIAGLALTIQNFAAGEEALKTAVSMDPQLEEGWRMLARVQLAGQKFADVEKTLRHGIEELPEAAALHHSLGVLLAQMGRDREASAALQKAAELAPLDLAAHIDLGAVLTKLEDHERASSALDAARALAPDSPDLLALVVENRIKLGRFREARNMVGELVQRFPQYRLPPQLRALLELPQ